MINISIVVPVYNVADYLPQCIDSIRNQTYTSWELILVDDGSKDESGELCDKFAETDERIKVIHIQNSGVSTARNIGLKNARGIYVAFVDGDDWIEPDMYEKLIVPMQDGADIAFCRLSSSLTYYYTYTVQSLLSADGRDYVIQIIQFIVFLITSAVKIGLILLSVNIVILEIAYLVINILQITMYQQYIRKQYKWIDWNEKPNTKVLKNRKHFLLNGVAWTVFSSTDTIIISTFCLCGNGSFFRKHLYRHHGHGNDLQRQFRIGKCRFSNSPESERTEQ